MTKFFQNLFIPKFILCSLPINKIEFDAVTKLKIIIIMYLLLVAEKEEFSAFHILFVNMILLREYGFYNSGYLIVLNILLLSFLVFHLPSS